MGRKKDQLSWSYYVAGTQRVHSRFDGRICLRKLRMVGFCTLNSFRCSLCCERISCEEYRQSYSEIGFVQHPLKFHLTSWWIWVYQSQMVTYRGMDSSLKHLSEATDFKGGSFVDFSLEKSKDVDHLIAKNGFSPGLRRQETIGITCMIEQPTTIRGLFFCKDAW